MASPYDLVRVEDPAGHQFTTSRAFAAGTDLKVLSGKDATDEKGRPLPALPRTDKAGQPAPRTSKKEN